LLAKSIYVVHTVINREQPEKFQRSGNVEASNPNAVYYNLNFLFHQKSWLLESICMG